LTATEAALTATEAALTATEAALTATEATLTAGGHTAIRWFASSVLISIFCHFLEIL
jgi:hypothetical protein